MSCSNCVANWNLFSASCVILHAASSVATQFQRRVCYFYCRCVCLSHCQNVAAASITCIFKMTKLLLRLLILRFHDSLSLHLQRYSLLSYFGRSSKSVLNLSIYFCLVVDTVFQIVIYSAVRLKSFKIKPHWILVKADNSQ